MDYYGYIPENLNHDFIPYFMDLIDYQDEMDRLQEEWELKEFQMDFYFKNEEENSYQFGNAKEDCMHASPDAFNYHIFCEYCNFENFIGYDYATVRFK